MKAYDMLNDKLERYNNRGHGDCWHTLDKTALELNCPLDNGHHSIVSQHDLNVLSRLPPELLSEILHSLDLISITAFRRVNRHAMGLVDDLHLYKKIFRHCSSVLRAVISLGADSFSCLHLYNTLLTSQCHTCGNFGAYLYLITCKRVCFSCYTSHLSFLPMVGGPDPQERKRKKKTLEMKEMEANLPHVTSLNCSPLDGKRASRKAKKKNPIPRSVALDTIKLFDRESLLDYIRDKYPYELGQEDGVRSWFREGQQKPYERHSANIVAPSFDKLNGRVDWGYYCLVCEHEKGRAMTRDNKYSRSQFIRHLEEEHKVDLNGE